MKKTRIVLMAIFLVTSLVAIEKEVEIPRSMQGDKGKYFLIDSKKSKDIIQVTHKRVGVYETTYTKTEINCKTMKIRDIGDSSESVVSIKSSPTKWFDLVNGSSKSDLANFVCKLYKTRGIQ